MEIIRKANQMIQLYSLATPNGQKIGVALEEMEIPYQAHTINILEGEQFADEFIKINPNSKIPAIVDPNGPDGKPLSIMESGAILIYLAEKSGKFLPESPRNHSETLQWLFFQVGGIGPMFGQFGHFYKFAKEECQHSYPVERYTKETIRLLNVLEARLASREYLVNDEYTIADIATFPWVMCLKDVYEAEDLLQLSQFTNVNHWVKRCSDRPATRIGLKVCPFPNDE